MKKNKIEMLKNIMKYNRLTKLKKCVDCFSPAWLLLAMVFALIGFLNGQSLILLNLSIVSMVMCTISYFSEKLIKRCIDDKRYKLDDKIELLAQTNDNEKQVLKEYQHIKDLKKEIKISTISIKEMIKEGKDVEIKENEPLIKNLIKNNATQNTSGYSKTKVAKVHAEQVNKVVKEENENIKSL